MIYRHCLQYMSMIECDFSCDIDDGDVDDYDYQWLLFHVCQSQQLNVLAYLSTKKLNNDDDYIGAVECR